MSASEPLFTVYMRRPDIQQVGLQSQLSIHLPYITTSATRYLCRLILLNLRLELASPRRKLIFLPVPSPT